MDCVVTGGAGFIGSHLVDALLTRGDHVHVVDNLSTGRRENLHDALAAGAVLHELDVCDAGRLSKLFCDVAPNVVFHMGAQIDVRRSVQRPDLDASTNVLGTIAVLDAARACGARRVVNSSTGGGLYGDASELPTPEDYPIRPLAPYGQAKHAAEGYCDLYTRLHGLSTISLRYGNVYGPRQDTHGEAGVVAIFCGCLEEGRRPTVFGDGLQTRDWVEVSDVVRANLLAADCRFTGPINVAVGRETSVLDLLGGLGEITRELHRTPLPDPAFFPQRRGEVRRSCLDISRASSALAWEPSVTLTAGLARMVENSASEARRCGSTSPRLAE
jgi:UDP-glucose 4-epimerase